MRTCTASTQAQIAALSDLPTKPAWLKLAIYDATHDKPMSRKREERLIAALNLAPLPRLVTVRMAGDGRQRTPRTSIEVSPETGRLFRELRDSGVKLSSDSFLRLLLACWQE